MNLRRALFTLKHFLLYSLQAQTAHGLHSPFVYQLYLHVLKKKAGKREKELLKLRKNLSNNPRSVSYQDPKTRIEIQSTIRRLSKTSASRHRFGCFLVNLIDHMGYQSVLETGTSIGLTTCYLAQSTAKRVVSIEGSESLATIARMHLATQQSDHAEIIVGQVQEVFTPSLRKHQPELVFLDADHRSETIAFYLQSIQEMTGVKCIVIHDVYWSQDMLRAWQAAVQDQNYHLTIDIFQAGLIFPDYPMEKQHFSLKF